MLTIDRHTYKACIENEERRVEEADSTDWIRMQYEHQAHKCISIHNPTRMPQTYVFTHAYMHSLTHGCAHVYAHVWRDGLHIRRPC